MGLIDGLCVGFAVGEAEIQKTHKIRIMLNWEVMASSERAENEESEESEMRTKPVINCKLSNSRLNFRCIRFYSQSNGRISVRM